MIQALFLQALLSSSINSSTRAAYQSLAQVVAVAQPTAPPQGGSTGTNANGTDVYNSLRLYAAHARMNIIIDPSTPHSSINVRFSHVSDEEAFNLILQTAGLSAHQSGNITYIGPAAIIAARYGSPQGQQFETVSIPTLGGAQAVALLQSVLPPGTPIQADSGGRSVTVIGTEATIAIARNYIGVPENVSTDSYTPGSGRDAAKLAGKFASLGDIVAPNGLTVDGDDNSILIHGTAQFVTKAKAKLAELDTPLTQVLYNVSYIEVSPKAFTQNQGLFFQGFTTGNLSNSSSGAASGASGTTSSGINVYFFGARSTQLSVGVQAMLNNGTARILQRDTVTTVNGITGTSNYITHIPVVVNSVAGFNSVATLQSVDVGVQLDATPTIGTNQIVTALKTSYKIQTGTGQGGYPTVQEASDGQTIVTSPDDVIVISGLYSDNYLDNHGAIPPLSNIPIFGGLFRNRQVTDTHDEVIIVMQPHLVINGNTHCLPMAFPNINPAYINGGIAPNGPGSSCPAPPGQQSSASPQVQPPVLLPAPTPTPSQQQHRALRRAA